MDTKKFSIENGPSRDALFDATKYAYDNTAKVMVNFGIALYYLPKTSSTATSWMPMNTKNLKLTSIQHEDDSGHSFNLQGYCEADLRVGHFSNVKYESYKFKAFYNAKKRSGVIEFFT